ncbi:MAG: 5'/3'-nucleotidase SurE [Acidobacteria bacterium]|nr:MAG: 5'/3'-nucleotidase SurE [Acidobacteriota bacterium]
MMSKPLLLLSNDDGYFAEGLQALARTMRDIADILVVAPDQNCSGVSHKISLSTPLRLRKVDRNTYALNGSPADCIHVALHVLMKDRKPDLVLSGINHGVNLGEDTAYSGTVAAAYEAQAHGIPALAVSTNQTKSGLFHFKNTARVARLFARKVLNGEIANTAMWNINVPPLSSRGMKFTRLDNRSFKSSVIERKDPRGIPYYWLGPYHPTYEAVEGTDYSAYREGFISATPLKIDMTHNRVLNSMDAKAAEQLYREFQNESD